MRHYLSWAIIIALSLSLPLTSRGEEQIESQDPPASVKGVESFNISVGGTGLYRPETWGMISLSLRNPQPGEVSLLATTHFTQDPTLQYGRRLWLPPQSRMNSWHPIRMPAVTDPEQKFFELRTLLVNTDGDVETVAMNDIGAMQFDHAFRVSSSDPVTMVIAPRKMIESSQSLWANSIDFFLTARYERGAGLNLTVAGPSMLPPGEEMLDALDHLVISSDRILNDSAGLGAIRRWVTGGGSLWIMADQVSPELLGVLLGDEDSLTVVDRVELTHVDLVGASRSFIGPQFSRDLDQPVPLVRVVAENIDPFFSVNGWPAAFWKTYGNGRILVTTLGANGWLSSRVKDAPPPAPGIQRQTRFVSSECLSVLSAEFFKPRPADTFPQATVEQEVRQMIGYSIPTRSLILGTLLGFTAVLAGSALWLGRRGRLEWLGATIPLLALLAAGMLMATGLHARSEVTEASSRLEHIQAVPGTDDIRVTGVTGQFTQSEQSSTRLSSPSGGWSMPDMSGIEGVNRRLVWSDIDHWEWEKLTQKPGLRMVRSLSSGQSEQALNAIASFDAGALSGTVSLPPGVNPTDAILATSSGRLGLQISNDDQWSTTGDSVLGRDQYLAAEVLTDEQQRRSRILSEVLKPDPTRPRPPQPTLYLWTSPWSMRQLNSSAPGSGPPPPAGSALVSIPIQWKAPTSNTAFTIPEPLISFREVSGPDGLRPSGYFDVRSGKWVERTRSTSGWMAFEVPADLLPLQTQSAELTFKVLGAMGRLEILGFKDGAVQTIKTWDNPVGTLTLNVDDASLIPLDENGRFLIRIDAGISESESTLSSGAPTPANSRGSQPRPESGFGQQETPSPELSLDDPSVYWQFEDISARVSVKAPVSSTSASPSP